MNSYTHFNKVGAFVLLAASLSFSSCEKDDDNVCGGMPTISQVSATTDRTAALTAGNLADWVIIQGSNFCSVEKVVFNDVEASLADAYVTPTEITLRIPRAIPKNVNNKVVVTTAGGSAETTYTLSIPPLAIAGMSNEYTPAGQRMAIVGQNLDLYGITPEQGKVLWAGAEIPITKTTADSAYFVVPASAVKGTTLQVVDGNQVTHTVPGRYKDDRNILFGYDTGGSIWGGTTFITDGPTPAPISGRFIRVTQKIDAWAWTEFSTSNQLSLPSGAINNPAGYVLRFEMNTLKPFDANGIKFVIDGDANTYAWTPTTPFSTRGKWSTQTVNLNEIIKTPLDASRALHEFKFVFHGPGALDADIAFDNFRVVPQD